MTHYIARHSGLIAFCLIAIGLIFFLSFQFSRMTSFPIGDDPAIHVQLVTKSSWLEIKNQIYPLPLAIYKLAYTTTNLEAPKLFTIVISGFLFFSGISLFLFIYKGFNNAPVALAASIFFVTDRWVNDSLRMGTLAEVFGWGMLFLALTAFLYRHVFATFILSGLLVISHPFAFLVYILIILLYSILVYRKAEEEERKFLRQFLSFSLIVGGILSFFYPKLFIEFLQFRSGDGPGWGERSLWELFVNDNPKLLLIPLLASFGLAYQVKNWQRPAVKLSILVLLVGLFLSLNHMIGIQFLPFRFYAYFMGGIALFAGFGLFSLLEKFPLPPIVIGFFTLILAIYFSIPSYQVNAGFIQWQKNDPAAKASMQSYDLEAIEWIRKNIPQEGQILAERRYGIWIRALANREEIIFYDGEKALTASYTKRRLEKGPVYIFAPIVTELPLDAFDLAPPIYQTEKINIYKLMP